MKLRCLFRDIWTTILAIALLTGGAWVLVSGALLAWAIWTGQL